MRGIVVLPGQTVVSREDREKTKLGRVGNEDVGLSNSENWNLKTREDKKIVVQVKGIGGCGGRKSKSD